MTNLKLSTESTPLRVWVDDYRSMVQTLHENTADPSYRAMLEARIEDIDKWLAAEPGGDLSHLEGQTVEQVQYVRPVDLHKHTEGCGEQGCIAVMRAENRQAEQKTPLPCTCARNERYIDCPVHGDHPHTFT